MTKPSHQLSLSDIELRTKFYSLRTRLDLAELLEVPDSTLIYHLYRVPPQQRYVTFEIPKKSGGQRTIFAPTTSLKIIQHKLNQILQCVYTSQRKPSAHGFVRGYSIVTNAREHCTRRYILNLDLEDFFPSIHFGRVYGLFTHTPYNLPSEVAVVLAQICCLPREIIHTSPLPQGAPTSPIISNMICAKLDRDLQEFARVHRCFYTRYADDITFSTNKRVFPSALATLNEAGQVTIGTDLHRIIEANDFRINSQKVRLQLETQRQTVTGIISNEFPNVERRYVNRVRAMLHAWEKFGLEKAEQVFLEKYNNKHRLKLKELPHFQQVVRGRIEYIGMVRGKNNKIYQDFRNWYSRLAVAPSILYQFGLVVVHNWSILAV